MNYIALIGDIRQSKGLAERQQIQQRLRETCDELNQRSDELGLVSPFTITLGDEFQALFGHAAGLWRCIFRIESLLRPVRLRYGVGVGAIDTEINRASAIGMDGPAFHRAREAVDSLRQDGGSYRAGAGRGAAAGTPCARPGLAPSRRLARQSRGYSASAAQIGVAQMAGALDISEQAVYKNIRKGRLSPSRAFATASRAAGCGCWRPAGMAS
jgi:hypothetical protein